MLRVGSLGHQHPQVSKSQQNLLHFLLDHLHHIFFLLLLLCLHIKMVIAEAINGHSVNDQKLHITHSVEGIRIVVIEYEDVILVMGMVLLTVLRWLCYTCVLYLCCRTFFIPSTNPSRLLKLLFTHVTDAKSNT